MNVSKTPSAHPIASSALATFASSVVLFAAHRALTWSHLDDAKGLGGVALAKAAVVGLLSDVWVAALCSLIVLLVAWLAALSAKRWGPSLAALMVLALGALAVGHQSYVAFFHFQIVPFHLSYLADPAFLTANAPTFRDPRVIVTGCLGAALATATWILARREWPWSRALLVAMLGLSLLAHNRNIKYRVQWFVAENIQTHPLERLYLSYKLLRPVEPLTAGQVERLAAALGTVAPTGKADRTALISLLSHRVGPPTPGFESALRDEFVARRDTGAKPLIIMVMMESMRPSETGWHAPTGSGASLTPHFDRLAREGVAFSRAFSTGSVTRAGQEAVLCGYRSSRDLSLMRHPASPSYACLPSALAGRAESIWLHGGDGRFDGQLAFWQRFGVTQTMTSDDFPRAADRTGWGVGDVTFARHAVTRLAAVRRETAASQVLALLLTVSHHIPWDMPGDAPPALQNVVVSHPSYRTAAYADSALGTLVERLTEERLWDDTVLIVMGDHGNNISPATTLYQGDVNQAMQQSHVVMMLSGGLVTTTLNKTQQAPFAVDHPVTLTDVAVLAARLAGAEDFLAMSEGLFTPERRMPVLAMLEDMLFEPASGRQWRQAQLLQPLPAEFVLPLYMQRALMQQARSADP